MSSDHAASAQFLPQMDPTPGDGGSVPVSPYSVLVVDDSPMQRRIIRAQLKALGYTVREASSGAEALRACAEAQPDMVVSDWMMPGMDGIEFCRAFRQMERESYGYFLLLTAKSHRDEVALGFDAGADDFLTKPVQSDELRARLAAGARVLRMEKELVRKNGQLADALGELQTLYQSLDNDLSEARKLQQSLVKERYRAFGDSQVSLLLRPSGHVGGDLVGFVPVEEDRVLLFAIDVSGHGVASALMTARLSGYLMSPMPDRNVALVYGHDGGVEILPPATVARRLNTLSLAELATDTYFTMVLADVDLRTGATRLVQAGHPHPVILKRDGAIEPIGSGGVPIGLIDGVDFEDIACTLAPGDKLLMISDGITECENPDGEMLEDPGLHALVAHNRALQGPAFLEALTWGVAHHADGKEFGDDISAVLFEFNLGGAAGEAE
ncbi:MAG: SpoIIE family protein phosphatase [Pseudomonadota bacterium]